MRCRICDNEDANILDPKVGEHLCLSCASIIQDTIGTNWEIDNLAVDFVLPEVFDYRDDDWTEDG